MKQRDWIMLAAGIIAVQAIFNMKPYFIHEKRNYRIPENYKIHEEKDESWLERAVNDPTALFTLLLTFFTGGLFLATRSLWTSTEKLALGAERTAAMQLRAYVGVNDAQVSSRDTSGNPLELILKITNFGETPAFNYSIRVAWMDERSAFDRTADHLPPRGNPSTLMPGQTDEISLYQTRANVSFGVIFGIIKYTDAFGECRFNKFRYRSRLGSNKFTPDKRGNASD